MNIFEQGQRIALTANHIATGNRHSTVSNAVVLALEAAAYPTPVKFIVFPMEERINLYYADGQGVWERTGNLYTTTAFEDWFKHYVQTGEIAPTEMYIFCQDDAPDDDDRLWIGVDLKEGDDDCK